MISGQVRSLLKKVDNFIIVRQKEDLVECFIRDNSIDQSTGSVHESFSVQLWKGKRRIAGSFSNLDVSILRKLLSALRSAPEKDYFYGLPKFSKPNKVELFDRKVASLTPSDLADQACQLKNIINRKGVDATFGVVGKSVEEFSIETSAGVDASFKGSRFTISASGTVSGNEGKASAWDGLESRRIASGNSLGQTVRDRALEGLRQKSLKSIPKNVILEPRVASQLLSYGILPNLNLSAIEEKKSFYASKVGESIWNGIQLTDNPTLAWGNSSYPFDWEGSASRKTTLVSDGILKGFISDFNTSKHLKQNHTPNATLGGISFSNVSLSGKRTEEEGLVIGDVIGAHTAEPLSTRFSVVADNACIIKKGERIPVKPFMLSGSLDEMLKGNCRFTGKVECRDGIFTRSIVTSDLNVIR